MTYPTDTTDIDAELEHLLDGTPIVHLRQGPWLELAAQYDICCDTQTNGPSFTWMEDTQWGGWHATGSWNAQCGGCGSQGAGWVTTGAWDTSADDAPIGEQVRYVLAYLLAQRDSIWQDADAAIRVTLRECLADAQADVLRWMDAMCPADSDDDWPTSYSDLLAMVHEQVGADWPLGSDERPGVTWNARTYAGPGAQMWQAWEYAADSKITDDWDVIVEDGVSA